MKRVFVGSVAVLLGVVSIGDRAIAQVIRDNTVGTQVTQTGAMFRIDGGARSGNNLFHSFSQFSIPANGSAIFKNALDVQNIFSRVTGTQISNIDGILKSQGSANLFLMNPNGIVFGPNAQLQLGGSFLGTTANSIKFADGIEFNTVNVTPALLSVKVPIGLQMGATSGNIRVEGQGGTFLRSPNLNMSLIHDPQQAGLQVSTGKTLALLGNSIHLDGGVLRAESGQIELGSVSTGTVSFNPVGSHWQFSYPSTQNLSTIQLTRAALVDASGTPGGSIQLQGKDIQILNSSKVILQHQGPDDAIGQIKLSADRLELSGVTSGKNQSLILTENLSQGQGANIQVLARQVIARDGGEITSATFQNGGNGGNITVQATESVYFAGYNPFDAALASGILSRSNRGGGRGGNVRVMTPDLALRDGAAMNISVVGGRVGGDAHLTTDRLSLIGENLVNASGTFIAASSGFGGNAGSLTIETGQILLRSGGTLSASTSGAGNAGSLTIHARESIEIDGTGRTVALPSRIIASAQQLPLAFRRAFGLPDFPTGNGGNLSITAPTIKVSNGGFIAAENVGIGNAGTLKIHVDSLRLDNQSAIKTSTTVGNGGNLELVVRDLLLIRHNSSISAKAGGTGKGGNIAIDSPIIVGLENSDIIANAVKGKGGNIQIDTQSIFGLKYRDRLTSENDITASSEFGVNGNVQVNTIGISPANALNTLPADVVDSSRQIADRCGAAKTSSFIATGRGGMPQGPMKKKASDRPWNDLRVASTQASPIVQPIAESINPSPIVEASAFEVDESGSITLVAARPLALQTSATCGMGTLPQSTQNLR